MYFAPIAQSVERLPFKEMVAGSIPAGRTKDRAFFKIFSRKILVTKKL